MDFSQAKFVDVDGIGTRYFEMGSGETVVLFHGGNFGSHHGADCAADWNLNFDGLAEECRVIAVDKIGQGYTDNPETRRRLHHGTGGEARARLPRCARPP